MHQLISLLMLLQLLVMGEPQQPMVNKLFLASAITCVSVSLIGIVGMIDQRNHTWAFPLTVSGLISTSITGFAGKYTDLDV
jgi:hypothetical protein